LLAGLITEAVCSEIARRGVANGVFLTIQGAETDAIRREQINLQNKYVHKIHEHFVDAQLLNISEVPTKKKGCPSKDEMLAKAMVAG
jgi:hypothetical protein